MSVTKVAPMTTWIIKSETDDPEGALKIFADQRTKGYTAWIEDERGKAVDEESLRKNEAVPSKPSVRERWQGLLVVFGSAMAALVILYAIGSWVDH
jgi:hypothetical protein